MGYSPLNRLKIIKLISIAITAILFLYYSYVMLISNRGSVPKLPHITRGNILDRNGRVLAFEKEVSSLYGWVPELKNINESSKLLSPILNIDKDKIYEYLSQKRDTSYFYISRQLSNYAKEEISKLISQEKLPGISIDREFGRNYPEGDLTAHITGYVGYDNVGLDGIEYTLNSLLSPKVIKSSDRKEYGHNVELTIDVNLQYITSMAAQKAYEENFADSVSVIAMDAKNGEILSYVSYPSFDPNKYNDYSVSERINRIAQTSYEPGSVFKVFSVASFLENGGIDNNTSFYCDGLYHNEESDIKINCLGNHGVITTPEILVHSCNDGTGQASETISQLELYSTLKKFGFGKKTGITFNGESNGILRNSKSWSYRSKPTISMGQEVSVSAMQIVTASTALSNGGVLLKPHIVKRIISSEGVLIKEYNKEPIREVISPKTARDVLNMMKETTERGTGIRTKIEGLNISTKTGTAQITDPETKKYYDDKFLASALAIFPTEDPKIIIYVVIENPKGQYIYGSRLAIPVIKDLTHEFTNYLNIETGSSPIYRVPSVITKNSGSNITFNGIAPDLTGLSKREVQTILQENNIKFNFNGSGNIYNQTPKAGEQINSETIFILDFK